MSELELESELESEIPRATPPLQNHVIICGFGHLGQNLAQQLSQTHEALIVIDQPQNLELAKALNYAIYPGDPTEEAVLLAAGIQQAKALATVLPDDASNVFITLTARGLNRKLLILARGDLPETERKLKLAGADHTVLPAAISATRLVNLITNPNALHYLEQSRERSQLIELLTQLGMQIQELVIPRDSPLIGLTLEEIESKARGALLVIALQQVEGELITQPTPDLKLAGGDTAIVLGHPQQIKLFARQYLHRQELRYRGGSTRS
jgi:voltage-gated potassium channel